MIWLCQAISQKYKMGFALYRSAMLLVVFGLVSGLQKPVANSTVDRLNAWFRTDISGTSANFWELVDTLYMSEQSDESTMVLLLNNTFTSKLSLHTLVVRNEDESVDSELAILQHEQAESQNGTEYVEALGSAAEEAGYSLELTEDPTLQQLEEGSTAFSLYRGRGWGNSDAIIEIAVVSDITSKNTTYISELYNMENYAGLYNLTLYILIIGLASCASCTCLYSVIWCFYKRNGKLPCFDKQSSEELPALEMHPQASNQ